MRHGTVIPTFQEIVSACNRDRLIRTVLSDHVESVPGIPRRESLVESIRGDLDETIEEMTHVDTAETSMVAIARERFALVTCSTVRRCIEPVYFDLDAGTPSYTLSKLPWRESLGCMVWLGSDSCLGDRYGMLASMCWDIVSGGWSESESLEHAVLQDAEPEMSKYDLWSYNVAGQWDFSEPDPVSEERCAHLRARVKEWNDAANVRFLADAAELRQWIQRQQAA